MERHLSLECVVDLHPRFFVEVVLWSLCVKRYIPADVAKPVVWFVGDGPDDLIRWLRDKGIETRTASSLLHQAPHCNKIIPFMEATENVAVAVTDTDLYFVDSPVHFLGGDRFRAPPNNHCNPPPFIWRNVLSASGIGRPYRPSLSLFSGIGGMRETFINNVCGSIIFAPTGRSKKFAEKWLNWAKWLIDNREILERWRVHVDQMSFALALEEIGEDVDFLPPQLNTILHLFEQIETPYAFHLTTGHLPNFANRFHEDRTMASDGLSEMMSERIERLNDCIREAVMEMAKLPSTRDHLEKFLNPSWRR